MTPAVYCEHANEVPQSCPCQRDCYCRVEGSCRRLVITMPTYDSKGRVVPAKVKLPLKKPVVEEEDDRSAARKRFSKLEIDDEAKQLVEGFSRDLEAKFAKPLKVTKVSYGRTVNLGNYQSARIDLEAQVSEGEDFKTVFEKLKVEVLALEDGE